MRMQPVEKPKGTVLKLAYRSSARHPCTRRAQLVVRRFDLDAGYIGRRELGEEGVCDSSMSGGVPVEVPGDEVLLQNLCRRPKR